MEKKRHDFKVAHKRKRLNKTKIVILACAIVALAAIVFLVVKFRPQSAQDKVLATVNGVPIYAKEIDGIFNRMPEQYRLQYTKEILLNQTIGRELLLQEAKFNGIVVEDNEIMQLIEQVIEQNQITREQLIEQLASQNMTMNDMVDEYKKQVTISRLLNKTVYTKFEPNPDEVVDYYSNHTELFDQVKASHILVNSSDKAEEVMNMIKDGADFSSVAKTYSLDPYSGPQGGDLGYFSKSQMVQEFSEKVFGMDIGELGIIKTQFGYHVAKITAKRIVSFQEAKDQIRNTLISQKQSIATAAVEDYIRQLWQKAKITFY